MQGEKLVNRDIPTIFATLNKEGNLKWSHGLTSDVGIQCISKKVAIYDIVPLEPIESDKPEVIVDPIFIDPVKPEKPIVSIDPVEPDKPAVIINPASVEPVVEIVDKPCFMTVHMLDNQIGRSTKTGWES